MKILRLFILMLTGLTLGCDSADTRARKKTAHLASLTCNSAKEGRTKEELQAIGDACFRGGRYSKSSGKKW